MSAVAQDEDDEELDPGPDGFGWRTILSRVLAATVGGYLLCYMLVGAIARHSPLGKVDTVLTSTMIGLVVYIGLVIWVFAAKSTPRVWAGLLAASAIFFVISII